MSLRWTWDVSFGPYARASVASQPLGLLVAALVGFSLAFFVGRDLSLATRAGAGVVLALLTVGIWLALLFRQLRRRRRSVRGQLQTYALSPDALVLTVGQDSYSLPTDELSVSSRGRDWIAVRRPALGRQPLLLFFDDLTLVDQVEAVLREHGTGQR